MWYTTLANAVQAITITPAKHIKLSASYVDSHVFEAKYGKERQKERDKERAREEELRDKKDKREKASAIRRYFQKPSVAVSEIP